MIDNLKRCIGDENSEMQKKVIEQILKPYARELIFSNDDLAKKSPVGSFVYRILYKKIPERKTVKKYKDIIKEYLSLDTQESYERATEIVGIINGEDFKKELVNKSLKDTDLQVIGKIHTGFNGTVNNIIGRTVQMLLDSRDEEKADDQKTNIEQGTEKQKQQEFFERYAYNPTQDQNNINEKQYGYKTNEKQYGYRGNLDSEIEKTKKEETKDDINEREL